VEKRVSIGSNAVLAFQQPIQQERNMSRVNGDKSRFNRVRKQNAAKRKRNREALARIVSGKPAASGKTKPVSA
jgi:hypothetical protein